MIRIQRILRLCIRRKPCIRITILIFRIFQNIRNRLKMSLIILLKYINLRLFNLLHHLLLFLLLIRKLQYHIQNTRRIIKISKNNNIINNKTIIINKSIINHNYYNNNYNYFYNFYLLLGLLNMENTLESLEVMDFYLPRS